MRKHAILGAFLFTLCITLTASTATAADVIAVKTVAASQITAAGATISGNITVPGGVSTVPVSYGYDYGLTPVYGWTVNLGSTSVAPTGFSFSDTPGLTCNTLYHYRVWATTNTKTIYGDDMTLSTLPCFVYAPVRTDPATLVTQTSATLNGEVTAITGAATTATGGFRYGTTTGYGNSPASLSFTLTASSHVVRELDGLACNTAYHYQMFTSVPQGASYGNDLVFVTLPCSSSQPATTASVTTTSTVSPAVPITPVLPPTNTAPVATYVFSHSLGLGSSGSDVTALQKLLEKDGDLVMPSGVSYGYLGNTTLNALEGFQVKYGIAASGGAGYGTFGPKTRAKANTL